MISESSVIGACLLDNDAYWRVGKLEPQDFTDRFLGEVWREIRIAAESGDGFDPVTLADNTDLPLADLLEIANNTPGSANVESYAKTVRREADNRRAATYLTNALQKVREGDNDAIPELQQQLEQLANNDNPSVAFYDALQSGLAEIKEAQKRAKDGVVGAPTGLRPIDQRTGGLSGPKLIILAARPSLGKTALALQMAQSAAAHGYPVGFMSLEMSSSELAVRSLAHQYQVNGTRLSFGHAEEIAKLTERIAGNPEKRERIKNLPIHVDEDSYRIGEIIARATEWHRRHKIKLLVIDHLQLIEVPSGFSRNDGLGQITRKLKILAKRLNIPVLLLCQFSRYMERENREPKLSDLRDSGNIEQDADIVIALHSELAEKVREVRVLFLKNRGGVVGGCPEPLIFKGPEQTFGLQEYRYEERDGLASVG